MYCVVRNLTTNAWASEMKTISEDKQREVFSQWKEDISEISKCSNVAVKISGLTMNMCLPARKLIDEGKLDAKVTLRDVQCANFGITP